MSKLALVSCVSQKASNPLPAKDLYTSQWFRSARRYTESLGIDWLILSAKYGVVEPDRVISPYNLTLNRMNREQRAKWAVKVYKELAPYLVTVDTVIILAGERYREYLPGWLRDSGKQIVIPLIGLPIGKQLQRLGELSNVSNK